MRILILLFIFISCEGGGESVSSTSEDSTNEATSSINTTKENYYGVYTTGCSLNMDVNNFEYDFGNDDTNRRIITLDLKESGSTIEIKAMESTNGFPNETDCKDHNTVAGYSITMKHDIEFEFYTESGQEYLRVDFTNSTYRYDRHENHSTGTTICNAFKLSDYYGVDIDVSNETCAQMANLHNTSMVFEVKTKTENTLELYKSDWNAPYISLNASN